MAGSAVRLLPVGSTEVQQAHFPAYTPGPLTHGAYVQIWAASPLDGQACLAPEGQGSRVDSWTWAGVLGRRCPSWLGPPYRALARQKPLCPSLEAEVQAPGISPWPQLLGLRPLTSLSGCQGQFQAFISDVASVRPPDRPCGQMPLDHSHLRWRRPGGSGLPAPSPGLAMQWSRRG